MSKSWSIVLIASCAFALLALDASAAAEREREGSAASGAAAWVADDTGLIALQRGCPSLSDAVEQVRRRYNPQRIISANTRRKGNREVHNIKILTQDNKVRTVTINGCEAA